MDWAELLDFWFGKLDVDGFSDDLHRRRWFQVNAAFDEELRVRFGRYVGYLDTGSLNHWLEHPPGELAYVLLCDQLPRNLFRGTPRAFAYAPRAQEAARGAINRGDHRSLSLEQRAFLYMPFEHSEQLTDQHLSVGLFTQLRDLTPSGKRQISGQSLRFAQQHRDIIERFGRFPHRNEALGRTSTAAEQNYLAQANHFGQ